MLYIIRHGKTDWNVKCKLQGQTDIPLNSAGREMAIKAGKENKVKFDICFCSPLVRAAETAKLFLEGTGTPIVYDDRLKEMNFGIYEGVEQSFKIPGCPVNVFFQDPANYKGVEGGESMEELFERTGEVLNERILPLVEQGKSVLIVGHGAMNSSIICRLKNRSYADFWQEGIPNCGLIKIM